MTTVTDLNESYADFFLPNTVWLCVCIVVGIVGNSLVLFVYGTRMRSQVNDRYFIRILAFLDLLSSVLSSLNGIFNYIFYAIYTSETLCKFFNFGSFFTSALSAQTLLLIAIQRYRKVCVPFGKQMTLFWKRLAIVISTIGAFVYSFPIIFKADVIQWREQNVTAYRCTNGFENELFNQIFFIGVSVLIITNLVSVTVLYSKIAFSIYSLGKKKTENENKDKGSVSRNPERTGPRENFEKATTSDSQQSTDTSTEVFISAKDMQSASPETETKTNESIDEELTEAGNPLKTPQLTGAVYNNGHSSLKEGKNAKWERAKVNFNKMFGVIVIFYLMSYIPTFFILGGLPFGIFDGFDMNVLMFISRMYIINHIVNPFVYGYFDFSFRASLKSLFKCGR